MKNLSGILLLGLVLIGVWVLASVTRFIVGALLHLLLVAGLVLLVVWAVRRIR